ncbi:hypothetical protein PVAP13_4NG030881 [Panicum virgatum]|uniref:Uncharacterized protein n=1 Tax=Panicum virgatum TaxID=38727 RepID=A0A8T0SY95_PANVG|nr:hypothetical protein PVAP13_4NG030881 [Panicum virgatum]
MTITPHGFSPVRPSHPAARTSAAGGSALPPSSRSAARARRRRQCDAAGSTLLPSSRSAARARRRASPPPGPLPICCCRRQGAPRRPLPAPFLLCSRRRQGALQPATPLRVARSPRDRCGSAWKAAIVGRCGCCTNGRPWRAAATSAGGAWRRRCPCSSRPRWRSSPTSPSFPTTARAGCTGCGGARVARASSASSPATRRPRPTGLHPRARPGSRRPLGAVAARRAPVTAPRLAPLHQEGGGRREGTPGAGPPRAPSWRTSCARPCARRGRARAPWPRGRGCGPQWPLPPLVATAAPEDGGAEMEEQRREGARGRRTGSIAPALRNANPWLGGGRGCAGGGWWVGGAAARSAGRGGGGRRREGETQEDPRQAEAAAGALGGRGGWRRGGECRAGAAAGAAPSLRGRSGQRREEDEASSAPRSWAAADGPVPSGDASVNHHHLEAPTLIGPLQGRAAKS